MSTSDDGLVLVYTGKGKGKTTAALGIALRAVGHGQKVLMIQFIKGEWHYGEITSSRRLEPELELIAAGKGFVEFDPRVRIAGLIVNNLGSQRHQQIISDAVSSSTKLPLLGLVNRNPQIGFSQRHLGLIPTAELNNSRRKTILHSCKYISDQIEIEKLYERLTLPGIIMKHKPALIGPATFPQSQVKVAVALDESFSFYYSDNLDALRLAGAQLDFFSPLADKCLPEGIGGIIIGGGFPEVIADELERNNSMKKSISDASADGMPIYAECGGLMYLCKSIRCYRGERRPRKMVGLFDAETIMTKKLTLGYTEALCEGSFLGSVDKLRGHEFHYSKLENLAADTQFAYTLQKGNGISNGKDGIIFGSNSLAAYMHLHFSNTKLPTRFVTSCLRYLSG